MRGTILAVAAALLSAAAVAQTSPPAALPLEPPPGALLAPGTAPSFAFFTTGDVIGYLDPCG